MNEPLRLPIVLPPDRPLTFQDVVSMIRDHRRAYPRHGPDCACLDRLIGRIRRDTTVAPIADRAADRELRDLQIAVDHVLHVGSRWRR